LGHAEALGVLDFFEQNFRPTRLPPEILDGRANAAFNNVIAENHAKLAVVGKVPGQIQRLGDAALTLLIGVVDMGQSEVLSVGQQTKEIASVLSSGYHQDVLDAGVNQSLDRVINHGLVVDRKQVIIGDFG